MNRIAMRVGMVMLAAFFCAAPAAFAKKDKISLGVKEFRNNTHAGWWHGGVGDDLASMLSNELSSSGKFSLVERDKLKGVLDEQELAESGKVNPKKAAKAGQLTGAQYIVYGTVSAYEEDTSSTGGGISFGGISVGGDKGTAYLAVDIRVIDTTTGEVELSRTIEGKSGSGGLSVGFYKSGLGGNLKKEEKTPAGKAIRACVVEISEYLECAMVDKDDCMDKYKQKEEKRRKKTKEAIDLDE